MPVYHVYSREDVDYDSIITAETPEEAQRIVEDGEHDLSGAFAESDNFEITGVELMSESEYQPIVMGEKHKLIMSLVDAKSLLEKFIGAPCECNNIHIVNHKQCVLCEYQKIILEVESK